MMNYEIFKEVVKEKFMDYMPEKFKGMELVAEPVEKVNVTLDGIILREEGRNISPTIYINDMYKKYQDCGDLEETLMAACDFMIPLSLVCFSKLLLCIHHLLKSHICLAVYGSHKGKSCIIQGVGVLRN